MVDKQPRCWTVISSRPQPAAGEWAPRAGQPPRPGPRATKWPTGIEPARPVWKGAYIGVGIAFSQRLRGLGLFVLDHWAQKSESDDSPGPRTSVRRGSRRPFDGYVPEHALSRRSTSSRSIWPPTAPVAQMTKIMSPCSPGLKKAQRRCRSPRDPGQFLVTQALAVRPPAASGRCTLIRLIERALGVLPEEPVKYSTLLTWASRASQCQVIDSWLRPDVGCLLKKTATDCGALPNSVCRCQR